jgi:transcriptional regulator with GAF, ATPase, and Fis domain
MFARLTAIGGPLAGASLPLSEVETSVGRDETNLVALADPAVSARHCLLVCTAEHIAIRDLDPANPSFVNGLPAGDRFLSDGDQIQIGGSLFVLRLATGEDVAAAEGVSVNEMPAVAPFSYVLHREDVFAGSQGGQEESAPRVSRDLDALIRISGAINAIHGLVALERPLMALIADVVPASRGAVVLSGDRPTEIASAAGWSRAPGAGGSVQVSRPVVERVLREAIGILTYEFPEEDAAGGAVLSVGSQAARSVLAAPLVAFDKVLGAIVLEKDGSDERFDEGHLRLLMTIAGIAATALEHARQVESLERTNRLLLAQLNLDHNMVGESPAMRDMYRRIARVAPTDSTVLLTGESGTGKELVARAIHRNSPRAQKPFVAINCAAITETLLESELFGHEKGAFTGAVAQKKGKLETAEGGTVFLDEIGELSLALQSKLLRVLQEREFDRVGGTTCVRVDFRLLAATNRDLDEAIASGLFRRDLYYRLNVVSLALPPLRERRDDIPLLASWFIRRHADKAKRPVSGFSADALACLTMYEWPGNVRELENAVEHAVVLGLDPIIARDDLPDAVAEAGASSAAGARPAAAHFHDTVKQTKKDLIVRAVEEADGNYNAAARLLGLHPNYLHRLIKNLQLKATLENSS